MFHVLNLRKRPPPLPPPFCLLLTLKFSTYSPAQADARVIWDYMVKNNGPGRAASDFAHTPEGEEASAMEILGTAGIAAMGPQVCHL